MEEEKKNLPRNALWVNETSLFVELEGGGVMVFIFGTAKWSLGRIFPASPRLLLASRFFP